MMSDPAEITPLMRTIVGEFFPDEAFAFELKGPAMIKSMQDDTQALGASRGDFGLLGESEVVELLDFVKLAAATLALIRTATKWILSLRSPDEDGLIVVRWTAELMNAGLPEKKAKAIAHKFAGELGRSVRKAHPKS